MILQCCHGSASEQNNDYFTVYRSDNGEDWTLVEDILAAGNSNVENYYTTTVAGVQERILLKLEQTDFDGTATNLGVLELNQS